MPLYVVTACLLASAACLLTGAFALAQGGTIRSSGSPEVVIYSNDFALVREPKTLSLTQGAGAVTLEGLPLRVDSSSVRLEGPGLRVRRQSHRKPIGKTGFRETKAGGGL